MVRGTVPRQPSKFGRQAGVKAARPAVKASTGVLAKRAARKAKPLGSRVSARAKPAKPPLTKKQPATKVGRKQAGGYDPLDAARIRQIMQRLDERYPNVKCALHHRSAWELLVATILSAQCTDVRVNLVTPELFKKYPSPEAFAALQPEALEPDIRSTGFFRSKAKSLVGAARKIVTEFGGEVPDEMDKLLSLPGVARKTANVVLGSWFGKAEGLVVDTHVLRIARRLELTTNTDPGKVEQDLMKLIPRAKWIDFSHQLIHHGRALCIARRPKCAECPLENLCHAEDKTWSTVELHTQTKVWRR